MNISLIIFVIVVSYLLIVNIVGIVICAIDKRRAIKHAWRIPEKRILMIAAVGGSIGVLIGMHRFRHKTQHLKFTVGVPAILICQIIIVGLIVYVV